LRERCATRFDDGRALLQCRAQREALAQRAFERGALVGGVLPIADIRDPAAIGVGRDQSECHRVGRHVRIALPVEPLLQPRIDEPCVAGGELAGAGFCETHRGQRLLSAHHEGLHIGFGLRYGAGAFEIRDVLARGRCGEFQRRLVGAQQRTRIGRRRGDCRQQAAERADRTLRVLQHGARGAGESGAIRNRDRLAEPLLGLKRGEFRLQRLA
jgi:hypothetical protein